MSVRIAAAPVGVLMASCISILLMSGCGGGGGGGGGTPVALSASTKAGAEARAGAEVVASAPSSPVVLQAVTLTGSRAPVFRLYNSRTNSHFYTMSADERDATVARFPQFTYEGVGFTAYTAPQPGLNVVYRFYNFKTGTHFYTIGEAERDNVRNTLSATYNYEGPAWYAMTGDEGSGIPMYRFYNSTTGTHFYTTSAEEAANVRLRLPQFIPEGVGYYAWSPDSIDTGGPTPPTPITLKLAEPVPIDRVLAEWAIDATGVGGDAGGDGGVGGTAGDGSPLRGVTVVLKDSTPLPADPPPDPSQPTPAPPRDPEVARGTTDANGRFLLKFNTASVVPPLILQVFDAGGNVLASTTEQQVPAGKAIRLNVNPLTDKIASDVLRAGVGSTDKRVIGSQIDLSKIPAARNDLVESSRAALASAGVTNSSEFDPMRSIYELDGKHVDAVIESITHSREPTTGATQLRTKLPSVETNADGSVALNLITANNPLSPSQVAVEGNPALTFSKIVAWMNEMNRCLALSSAARAADAACADADGDRLVASNFREDGKDLAEAYRTLYSEADLSAVPGSVLSNPAILVNIAGSTSPPEAGATIVEFTIDQPRTGPLAGSQPGHVRYTKTMTFVATASPNAKAGNWILGGNQRRYDASIQPAYEYAFQMYSSFRNLFPDYFSSLLEIRISPSKFDLGSRTYGSASIRAARVKGPGLPGAGLVLSPTSAPGAGRYLAPHNKTGAISPGTMTTTSHRPIFFLGMEKTPTSQSTTVPATDRYWRATNPSYADVPRTDYSPMQAYSRYTIEYFLTSNATGTPDWVETTRILAPVMPPMYMELLARNKFAPDFFTFFPGLGGSFAPGGCNFTLQWYNNVLAEPVDSAFITDGLNIINMDVNAIGDVRLNSVSRNACAGPDAATIEPFNQFGFRQGGVGATSARFRIYDTVRWN